MEKDQRAVRGSSPARRRKTARVSEGTMRRGPGRSSRTQVCLALFRLEALFSLRRAMADLTRKPPESVQVVGPSGELPVPTDLANERHYSIIEISKLWGLSEKTVRRIFEGEPGVIHWGSRERLHKRGYHTLRVPETVLHRVHRKLRKAS